MNKLLTLFSVFLVVCLITACDDNGDNQEIIQVLTENDFANDDSIRADFEENTIVKFLEPPGSDEPRNDTGEIGNDVIPVTYNRTVEHTFCWEDENEAAGHFMELSDSEGSLILRLDTNGECITEIIEAGDYIVTLFHDGLSEDNRPIFLIPNSSDLNDEQQATNQLTHYYRLVKEITLNYLHNSITKELKAQTVQENIITLLSTNSCQLCYLNGAKLSGQFLVHANLRGAILSGADLSDANLSGAILTEALLTNANLSGANLDGAFLLRVDLSGLDLSNAIMDNVFLNGSKLIGANLTNVDFPLANLSGANLSGADLRGKDFLGATFIEAVLVDADFRGANLTSVQFDGANLTNADFRGLELRGMLFRRSDLTNAKLGGADLTNAFLISANLSGADLSGADLKKVSLTNGNLTNADLSGAGLIFADLSGAVLNNTDLSGATWCNGCLCDDLSCICMDTCVSSGTLGPVCNTCICADPSMDTCIGCPTIEEVCTGN